MSDISVNEKRIASALSKAVTSAKRRTSRAVEAGTAAGYKYALDIHKKSKHFTSLLEAITVMLLRRTVP